MKKFCKIFILYLVLFSVQFHAKIKYGTYEHIKTIAEMPKTKEFLLDDVALFGDNGEQLKIDNKDYINLGVKYTTANFARMPFWLSEEPKLVGTSSLRKDMYYDISPQEAELMLQTAKISKENALKLSFWDKHLGWVVSSAILLALLIYYLFFAKAEEKKEGYYDNGDVIEDNSTK